MIALLYLIVALQSPVMRPPQNPGDDLRQLDAWVEYERGRPAREQAEQRAREAEFRAACTDLADLVTKARDTTMPNQRKKLKAAMDRVMRAMPEEKRR